MNRRHLLQGLLASSLAGSQAELWARGLDAASFASDAPELRPLRGLAGEGLDCADTAIEGHLPAGLVGSYYRNGPGLMQRAGQRYQHWFDGDGFVQAWRLEGGRVRHRGRFVQTGKFQAEQAAGRFVLPGFGTAIEGSRPVRSSDDMNTANTSVLPLDGRLYALWEGGSAYELDAATLETRGPKVWREDLRGMPFSAHPKVEPDGTVWNFGSFAGKLALYQLSPQGQVLRQTVLADVASPAMLHDFAVSERYLVFLLAPIGLDLDALRGGSSMIDAMRWRAADATRVLVVDKREFSRRIFEMPASHVFHFGNAWDDGSVIRLDYVQGLPLPEANAGLCAIMRGERPLREASTPRLLEIDLAAGRLRLQSRDEAVEFPVVDPRVVARRYRQVWYPTAIDTAGRWGFNGLMRLDLESGRRERFSFGADVVVEEHVLAPKPGSRREGEAWLLGVCYDIRRQRSFLSVFDAEALAAGPLAKAWLPYWVPYGFHGRFQQA